ncbi:MAG: ParB N-terminal domain-containing protein [Pseudomonadota bacterium]|nr:ParB N-terminal domain-containing protein [Pseudomonadota bacterium]
MAKRKRLGPARVFSDTPGDGAEAPVVAENQTLNSGSEPVVAPGLSPARRKVPPIASVAGASASEAALQELSETLRSAREEGRLIQPLPLDAIEADHLVRDRLVADEDEMQALMTSLRARGQQTPIEVVALADNRFGLISGWRRLSALRRLSEEDPAFGTVLAILRRPDSAAEAYCAMVEENEIRVGLSYYERARIVARAAAQGVYEDPKAALSGLFSSASRPKRSKIGSFVRLHDALDDVLRFPSAIPERLGLALVKEIDSQDGFTPRLRALLSAGNATSAEGEIAILTAALEPVSAPTPAAAKPMSSDGWDETHGQVRIKGKAGKLTLSGSGVTDELLRDLADWLAARG